VTRGPRVVRRSISKRGLRREENEDASAHRRFPHLLRAAVADGASDSSYAGQWARMLVRAYVEGRLFPHQRREPFSDALELLGRHWGDVAPSPEAWYAAQKRRAGAFATLAAISVRDDGRWRAMAIGDACIFQTRGGRLLHSFPMVEAAEFNSRPRLLATARPREWRRAVRSGEWRPGDIFILGTDAISHWILGHVSARARTNGGAKGVGPRAVAPPIAELLDSVRSPAAFARWVQRERETRALHNDDTTLLVIDTTDTSPELIPASASPIRARSSGRATEVTRPTRSTGASASQGSSAA
jgi:hypothetical protein